MQVVLLAAGLGSRLGQLTERLPKALIPVAGEPLLVRGVRFARRVQFDDIIVVGGYGFPDVSAEIARHALPVRLVENPRFRDGNLVSLMAARPHVRGGFLLMNVDHIYRPEIADRVRAPADDVTAFVDRDRTLGADDMKVATDEQGRIRSIAKTLTAYDCGYVGMTLVPAARAADYWATADRVLAADGPAVHVERVLARLATDGHGPLCRDISGIGWLEVDTPEEREAAETAIHRAPTSWR